MEETLLCFLLLLQTLPAEIVTAVRPFRSVETTFPSTLAPSKLGQISVPQGSKPKFVCAVFCIQNPECHLYCLKGNECHLFYAYVASHYAGSPGDTFGFTSCYTYWYFEPNLIPAVASASQHSDPFGKGPDLALMGYYSHEDIECSITLPTNRPWYTVDFGQTRKISYVVLKTRDNEINFDDVQLLLGDSTTMSENPEFAMHNGPSPPKKTDLTLIPEEPMSGRYLSFVSLVSNGALSVCALIIVGE